MYSKNVKMFSDLVTAAVKCRFLRMQKMILLTDIFRLHCKVILQTDFFCNKFRRTNNLFGLPSYHLRYFSKDKRKRLWGHKYFHCYRGRDNLPSRGGQMPGRGGKENEIAICEIFNKPWKWNWEEGGSRTKTTIVCSAIPPVRPRPKPRSRSSPPPPSFRSPFLHPAPPARSSTTPASPPPRVGRAIFSSYPSPAVPLLPSFFIKLPKQKSMADVVSS